MVSLVLQKFVKLTEVNTEFGDLPKSGILDDPFHYMLEVYMEYYIALAIPRSQYQLHNVANSAMTVIHDVLPPEKDDDEYAISHKEI